jgi:MarR family transcriptional regulator, transcriptional regulator for hemolysin
MSPQTDLESFGSLLHGTARAWRLKLDQRLKPMGLSQARWRTLMHLSRADHPFTQAEVAARLGIEEPTLVNLLHRLEAAGWVARKHANHDRRCKTVHLGPRAHGIISEISATADRLRGELLADISPADLKTCTRVLAQVYARAENGEKISSPKLETRPATCVSKVRTNNAQRADRTKPRRRRMH